MDNLWLLKRNLIAKLGDRTYVSVNYSCEITSDWLSPEEISWIVASFLVNRTPHSYLAVLGLGESGKWTENDHLDPPVGAPAGAAETDGSVFWRPYQKGLAIVNPSATDSATFRLPPGSWRDTNGGAVGSEVQLEPRSGLVLLRTH